MGLEEESVWNTSYCSRSTERTFQSLHKHSLGPPCTCCNFMQAPFCFHFLVFTLFWNQEALAKEGLSVKGLSDLDNSGLFLLSFFLLLGSFSVVSYSKRPG